ncbi:MAG: sialidase family protein [Woeseiaceae bacterium]|nr:sialidase family protein [Woeseiaceae bacterium]
MNKISYLTILLLFGLVACQTEQSTTTTLSAAADSMGPNLGTGPDGTVVLSWMEPDGEGHVLRYSVLASSGWGAAQTVVRGDNWFVNWADFPSVVPLSGSLWAAHWLQSQPAGGYAYDVMISLSEDGGETWSEPFMPHTDGTPTEHGFVTLYADGDDLGLIWLDGRKMVNEFDMNDVTASGMTLRAATFSKDQLPIRESLVDDLICDCCQTDIALTGLGPVAAYRNRTTEEVRDIYVARRVFGEWQDGVRVSADDWKIPACPVNGPIIRARDDTVVVAWFTAANDQTMVKAAWSADGGQTFGEPIVVNEEATLGHIGMEMMDDGSVVVVWHRREQNGKASLVARRVAADRRTSDVSSIAEAANVFAFSVPQIAKSNDDPVFVWTNAVNDTLSIESIQVPLDSFVLNR